MAFALRDHPRANGSYRDGRFELHSRVNVGVAVAAQDALVVPTVFDADEKSLGEIARETRALAERVRDATITPPELGGGTFTVSNLGMYGVRSFTAIINPPQAAILSVGSVARRAVVRDEQLLARHTMALTLVCDHRILYGAGAALFLDQIKRTLDIAYQTAWHLCHRIRAAMREINAELLRGVVEVDETYVGGKVRREDDALASLTPP